MRSVMLSKVSGRLSELGPSLTQAQNWSYLGAQNESQPVLQLQEVSMHQMQHG